MLHVMRRSFLKAHDVIHPRLALRLHFESITRKTVRPVPLSITQSLQTYHGRRQFSATSRRMVKDKETVIE